MSTQQPVEPTQPVETVPAGSRVATRVSRGSGGGLASRMIVSAIGAAGLIIGSFLTWLSVGNLSRTGIQIGGRVYFPTTKVGVNANFVASAGFVTLVLGLVVVLGLAMRSGWLTRLAGALGIIAMILFLITVYRAPRLHLGSVGIGAWLCLAGAIVALIAGFLGARTTYVERAV